MVQNRNVFLKLNDYFFLIIQTTVVIIKDRLPTELLNLAFLLHDVLGGATY